jgi:hypothetical protein
MLPHFDVGIDVDFYFFDFVNLGDICFVGAERTQCRWVGALEQAARIAAGS